VELSDNLTSSSKLPCFVLIILTASSLLINPASIATFAIFYATYAAISRTSGLISIAFPKPAPLIAAVNTSLTASLFDRFLGFDVKPKSIAV